jgi:hypothetical protein
MIVDQSLFYTTRTKRETRKLMNETVEHGAIYTHDERQIERKICHQHKEREMIYQQHKEREMIYHEHKDSTNTWRSLER